MKIVKVTYFKPSGKYYTHETFEISEELSKLDGSVRKIVLKGILKVSA